MVDPHGGEHTREDAEFLRYDELRLHFQAVKSPLIFVNQACYSQFGLDVIHGSLPKGRLTWAAAKGKAWAVQVSPSTGKSRGGELNTAVLSDISRRRTVGLHVEAVEQAVTSSAAKAEVDPDILLAPVTTAYCKDGNLSFNDTSHVITVLDHDEVNIDASSRLNGNLAAPAEPIHPYSERDHMWPMGADGTESDQSGVGDAFLFLKQMRTNVGCILHNEASSVPQYLAPASTADDAPLRVETTLGDEKSLEHSSISQPPIYSPVDIIKVTTNKLVLFLSKSRTDVFNPFNWVDINDPAARPTTEDAELYSLCYRLRLGTATDNDMELWWRAVDWREGVLDQTRQWAKDLGLHTDLEREDVVEFGEPRCELLDIIEEFQAAQLWSFRPRDEEIAKAGPYIYPVAYLAAAFAKTPGKKLSAISDSAWKELRSIAGR